MKFLILFGVFFISQPSWAVNCETIFQGRAEAVHCSVEQNSILKLPKAQVNPRNVDFQICRLKNGESVHYEVFQNNSPDGKDRLLGTCKHVAVEYNR